MNEIKYKIKRSRRARNVRLAVYPDASVVLTIPWWVPKMVGERFLKAKKEWVIDKLRIKKEESKNSRTFTRKDYLENKERARKFIQERLEHFNEFYNFLYNRISVRDTKTRWGSCSAKGNLNFNYRLLFLDKESADYIIVHELCHLRELNHSSRFWSLVEKTVPNYKTLRKKIRHGIQ